MMWVVAVAALVSALLGWVHYFASIPRDQVPTTPILMFGTQSLALVLATAAIIVALAEPQPPMGVLLMAGLATFFAVFFYFLYSQRRTPLGHLQVAVGDVLPDFSVTAADGAVVHSADWRGQRVLLKFFRGHW